MGGVSLLLDLTQMSIIERIVGVEIGNEESVEFELMRRNRSVAALSS
jgi:hypothetical protein